MKTFKLSLAAVVAAGALSSLSAAPLEEAIKDVDVSGWGRYRYDAFQESRDNAKVNGGKHRFTLDVNFKATLDDNFFSVIGLRYNTFDHSWKAPYGGISNTHGGLDQGGRDSGVDSLSIRQYYAGYKGIPDTTILFGRQPLGSFFDYDMIGTGVKVVNNSIEGLTLAAFAFDALETDADDATDIIMGPGSKKFGDKITQNNLYGAAAIGSWDWFSAQAWVAHLQNVATLWAIDLGANYAVSDDISLRGKVQVAGSALNSSFKDGWRVGGTTNAGTATDPKWVPTYDKTKDSLAGNSTFIGVKGGISAYGLDADVGYARYGKKGKTFTHALQYTGGLIFAGENLVGYTEGAMNGQFGSVGVHNLIMAKLKYTYEKYWAGFDFVYDKAKGATFDTFGSWGFIDNAGNLTNGVHYKNGQEYVVRVGYDYSDKLKFNAWYSWLTKKYEVDATKQSYKNKWNWFRFNAVYTF